MLRKWRRNILKLNVYINKDFKSPSPKRFCNGKTILLCTWNLYPYILSEKYPLLLYEIYDFSLSHLLPLYFDINAVTTLTAIFTTRGLSFECKKCYRNSSSFLSFLETSSIKFHFILSKDFNKHIFLLGKGTIFVILIKFKRILVKCVILKITLKNKKKTFVTRRLNPGCHEKSPQPKEYALETFSPWLWSQKSREF